jgi:hypothetical protein
MPRKSRIDAPGALHHIIARSIERKAFFQDDPNSQFLLEPAEREMLVVKRGRRF